MNTILVTTDLSELSICAFDLAKKMANALGAHIKLLHLIEDHRMVAPIPYSEVPVVLSKEEQQIILLEAQETLEEMAEEHFSELTVECFVRRVEGSTYRKILSFSKEMNIDLIVISTHGRTGIDRFLMGSVAERVARESTCPVLVVPPEIEQQ